MAIPVTPNRTITLGHVTAREIADWTVERSGHLTFNVDRDFTITPDSFQIALSKLYALRSLAETITLNLPEPVDQRQIGSRRTLLKDGRYPEILNNELILALALYADTTQGPIRDSIPGQPANDPSLKNLRATITHDLQSGHFYGKQPTGNTFVSIDNSPYVVPARLRDTRNSNNLNPNLLAGWIRSHGASSTVVDDARLRPHLVTVIGEIAQNAYSHGRATSYEGQPEIFQHASVTTLSVGAWDREKLENYCKWIPSLRSYLDKHQNPTLLYARITDMGLGIPEHFSRKRKVSQDKYTPFEIVASILNSREMVYQNKKLKPLRERVERDSNLGLWKAYTNTCVLGAFLIAQTGPCIAALDGSLPDSELVEINGFSTEMNQGTCITFLLPIN